ncbi:helix-turn-helix domain-containing protein [Rickettsiales bacterium]|nr:helix-turn-helix domain-containing protein [Rickettsiales bacterium]
MNFPKINSQDPPTQLLKRKEAAEFLGTTEGTLAVWASTKRYKLPYVKVGRNVRYRLPDLIKFLEENTTNYGDI